MGASEASVPLGEWPASTLAVSAPLVTAIAALVTAVAGAAVAGVGVWRSSKADEAKAEAERAGQRVDAQQVGLDYLRDALKAQGEQHAQTRADLRDARLELDRAKDRIGALESDLRVRTDERDRAVAELASFRRRGTG